MTGSPPTWDEIDFVIWTGDSARHDSDEDIPRSPAQVLGTNRLVADKFASTFAHGVPVVPTLGNNDILPHNILLPGPNKWLRYYTDIWRPFIPEEQRHSFEFGGWFYVEVIPGRLAVFSLNTLYFFDRNAGVDDCARPSEPGYKQMEWLRIQLQFMRSRGMKAMLMGHVPPARTDSKKLWDETCWQKYTLWLRQYRDVVVGGIFGHMNIDHFMLQDTEDVDLGLMTGASVDAREAMDDELSAESTADYLQELRSGWSSLEKPTSGGASAQTKKKKKNKKPKKHTDPWAERYQLSLVGPSIVPNYFPTIRVVEYNISGLEDAAVWADGSQSVPYPTADEDEKDSNPTVDEDEEESSSLELRSDSKVEASKKGHKKHDKKKKKPKHKDRKPKHPDLVVPDPPAKSAPPGPAYSPQPLTLTGYTQYFANLTRINNDMVPDEHDEEAGDDAGDATYGWWDWLLKWRRGKHGGKTPKAKKPKPREFEFEVEYDTRHDKLYKLKDLTVGSFVELAARMAPPKGKGKGLVAVSGNDTLGVGQQPFSEEEAARKVGDDGDDSDDEAEDDETEDEDGEDDEDSEDEDEVDTAKKDKKHGDKDKKKRRKKHGGKHKDKKRRKKADKVWLHFLRHAFVSTVDKDELKKMA